MVGRCVYKQTERQTFQYDSSLPSQQAISTYRLHTEALHGCYQALTGLNCSVRDRQPFSDSHAHVKSRPNCFQHSSVNDQGTGQSRTDAFTYRQKIIDLTVSGPCLDTVCIHTCIYRHLRTDKCKYYYYIIIIYLLTLRD